MLSLKQLCDKLSQGQHQNREQQLKPDLLTRTSRALDYHLQQEILPVLTLSVGGVVLLPALPSTGHQTICSQLAVKEIFISMVFYFFLLMPHQSSVQCPKPFDVSYPCVY